MPKRRKGFVVKYALTTGIFEETVEEGTGSGQYYPVQNGQVVRFSMLEAGRDVAFSRVEAEELAKEMARRKLESLNKTIARVSKLEVKPKWRKGSSGN